MIDSITDRTGEVIYQHKSEGVQVFSRATASIMDNLLKEVVVKGATTQFHSELKMSMVQQPQRTGWVKQERQITLRMLG